MKKTLIFGSIAIALIAVLVWFGMKNKKNSIEFETETPFKTNIVKKTVATGKVVPLEEAEIKPKVSGIIEKIFVEEGAMVEVGDLLATIRVVPNVQSLNSAQGSVKNAQLRFDNAKTNYERIKGLYEKGVKSRSEFEAAELSFDSANQDLRNSQNNLQIIRKGSTSGMGKTANTSVVAEISGTILEIPVRKGNQVIESNTFNAGTTIAVIADMTKMIFEGKVDEAEVGKIKNGTVLEVSLGAIEKKKYPAKLNFIAPKGTEENGAVQFKIKGDVTLDDEFFVRAGYSANADIVLEKKDSVLSIKEALLQFDKKTDSAYVEVRTGDQTFEKKMVDLGISDGINVEILSGVSINDEIKIWNKTSKKKDDEEEDDN
ncbi:efflux RND transporter periplasmic adaptor subunit [uncultured Lutibacter sp.]|uniref:efflux RND transporter periplasmic adaptor subunit n=1 Tax=uncultured Lutibacter sp. TaxID=437739 RepID=UPI00260628B9|nr:efflux RND transporter periplasmic adaptor subunit [uncultured Lutibacter sp.]